MTTFENRRSKCFKKWVNHMLAHELFSTFVKPSTNASWRQRITGVTSSARILTLESSELNTISAFLAQGVLQANVHIPNPSPKVCDAILDAYPDTIVTHETVGELISSTPHKYDVVFLDYMCTAQGNATTCPSRDVQQLFRRKLMKTPGILATTFCKRNSQGHQQEQLMATA